MNPLIVANWKCNPESLKEAKVLLGKIIKGADGFGGAEIVICPPSIFISSLVEKGPVKFGVQNCFWEDKGAFTGEISVKMIEDIGCEYVIVGHSERRKMGETNEKINLKIKKILESKITPILCIGETLEEREEGMAFEVLEEQVKRCLDKISKEKAKRVVLAYEPIWAIGTGNFADAKKIEEVRIFLEKILVGKYDKKTAESIKIIYGGSVDSSNISAYLVGAEMDGVLVGGSSLKADEFLKSIKSAKAE